MVLVINKWLIRWKWRERYFLCFVPNSPQVGFYLLTESAFNNPHRQPKLRFNIDNVGESCMKCLAHRRIKLLVTPCFALHVFTTLNNVRTTITCFFCNMQWRTPDYTSKREPAHSFKIVANQLLTHGFRDLVFKIYFFWAM